MASLSPVIAASELKRGRETGGEEERLVKAGKGVGGGTTACQSTTTLSLVVQSSMDITVKLLLKRLTLD